jgi:hypothetical protein
MKTTALLLIGFLLGVAAASFAFNRFFHPRHPGMADMDRILSHLTSKLDLTADQKVKVEALLREHLPKADALREQGDKKFQDLRETFHAKLRPLLNEAQWAKFEEMVAQHRMREAQQDHPFGCSAPPTRTQQELPVKKP